MSKLAISGIGPLTTLFETTATSIGAGVVVGGFLAGITGLMLGRRELEDRVLRGGYIAGAMSLTALTVDLIVKYPA